MIGKYWINRRGRFTSGGASYPVLPYAMRKASMKSTLLYDKQFAVHQRVSIVCSLTTDPCIDLALRNELCFPKNEIKSNWISDKFYPYSPGLPHWHKYGVRYSTEYRSLWRHQMETFSTLLSLCAGNAPVTGGFPSQRGSNKHLWCFFVVSLKSC